MTEARITNSSFNNVTVTQNETGEEFENNIKIEDLEQLLENGTITSYRLSELVTNGAISHDDLANLLNKEAITSDDLSDLVDSGALLESDQFLISAQSNLMGMGHEFL